jgi:hypothetical protein
MAGVAISIPNVTYELDETEKQLLVEELRKMNPWAAAVADELDAATQYEPTDSDIVELARALDHLRNLGTLPTQQPIGRLRDDLVRRFPAHTYRLIPADGRAPLDAFAYGPIHAPPERLVDAHGNEWRVLERHDGTDPVELVVESW